jgi:hypothetical protein
MEKQVLQTKEDIIICKIFDRIDNSKIEIDIDHLSNRRLEQLRTIVSTIRCWFSAVHIKLSVRE